MNHTCLYSPAAEHHRISRPAEGRRLSWPVCVSYLLYLANHVCVHVSVFVCVCVHVFLTDSLSLPFYICIILYVQTVLPGHGHCLPPSFHWELLQCNPELSVSRFVDMVTSYMYEFP